MSDQCYPDITKLRVVDLKELCLNYGLDVKGKKADLQQRLMKYFDVNPKIPKSDDPVIRPENNATKTESSCENDIKSEQTEVTEDITDEAIIEKIPNISTDSVSENEKHVAHTMSDSFVHDAVHVDVREVELACNEYSKNDDQITKPIKGSAPENSTKGEKMETSDEQIEITTDDMVIGKDKVTSAAAGTITQDDAINRINNGIVNQEDENWASQTTQNVTKKTELMESGDEEMLTEADDSEEVSLPLKSEVTSTEVDDDIPPLISREKTETGKDIDEIHLSKQKSKYDEKASRRVRKSRWTETAQVVIGQIVSGPKDGPPPIPRNKEDGTKLTRAQRKKLRKKRRKAEKCKEHDSGVDTGNDSADPREKSDGLKVDVDYIADEPELDPITLQFSKVFDAFRAAQIMDAEKSSRTGVLRDGKQHGDGVDLMAGDPDSEEEDKQGEEENKISKKKLKKQSRLTVAELKQIVDRPDLVEMHDVTSMDPKLLVLLKSTRNSVAVPRHWSYKRKYLSGKRGIEKPPFELPEFIRKTGIMEMREALQQKESEQGMKAKMRQRVRPKLGKIDIDYQKLHDAFFRYQTKPKMSRHGDIYYEGKEYETRLRELKPGELTDELRTSLGMPLGNNATKVPPPWLIAMQRYGPPPSYPNLKIPGLNAPIPSGCSFGYHAGGWGKPPVDERGRPLYGDVFGVEAPVNPFEDEKPSEQLWGELDSDEESSSDDESEEESEEEGDQDGTGVPTLADPTIENGMVTPSGLSSQAPESATPVEIELRKSQPAAKGVDLTNPPPLYQVLQEKQVSVGKGMMGTSHVYDLKKPNTTVPSGRPVEKGTEISINPEDLELEPAAIAAKYQHKSQTSKEKEDMSDMMAEHLNKTSRDRKRKNAAKDNDPKSKKYKDFKF